MTLPAGYEHEITLVEDYPGRYRLLPRKLNSSGYYEVRGDRLVIVEPDDARLTGFEWKIMNDNTLILIEQPPLGQTGSDYLSATLTRQINRDADEETAATHAFQQNILEQLQADLTRDAVRGR